MNYLSRTIGDFPTDRIILLEERSHEKRTFFLFTSVITIYVLLVDR